LGLVLFAPKTTYPAHAHKDITESYICLSGATSENDAGVYVPGSMIINVPEHKHAITTSDREPALLAYAWTGARGRSGASNHGVQPRAGSALRLVGIPHHGFCF
jgi:dimethylpropiothetin dethiomethylase